MIKEMRKELAIEKHLNSRIQQKHDTELNWNKATNFIPKQGEIIVYDIDDNYFYERIKIGDGITPVTNLPFYLIEEVSELIEKLSDETLTLEWNNNILIFDKGIDLSKF